MITTQNTLHFFVLIHFEESMSLKATQRDLEYVETSSTYTDARENRATGEELECNVSSEASDFVWLLRKKNFILMIKGRIVYRER